MLIVSDGEVIYGIYFYGQKHFPDIVSKNDDLIIFQKVKTFLDEYFKVLNPKVNFLCKAEGTDFQMNVWKILNEIPYGETVSYGEIASQISETMSAQAVGRAVGRNPLAIVIPCHRVLGTNGKLTGYAAGVDRKIKLLKLEKVID